MGWTKVGNHYISQGKHNFIAESTNKLNMHPIIKMKGKIMLKPESISFIEVQVPRDISGNKKYCYIVGLGLNCKFIDLLFKCSVTKFIKISSHLDFIVSEIIYKQTDILTQELMYLR